MYLATLPSLPYIRLSELNGKISEAISTAFANASFWVIADVTNHTFKASKNYHYFELVEKDPDANQPIARISGTAWGKGALNIERFERITGQRFTNNINVLVNVSVQYHPVFGLRLNMNDIDINFTLGVLEQQRQATLERLVGENPDFIRKEGDVYITRNSQLLLPLVIQRVAVISSATSAGAEDFRHTLLNNPYGYQFFIDDYFTAVQGENNARGFLDKIIEVFNSGNPYDALVITRGGGAQTDFLIFDNYHIGRAVAKFPIPVITGIGHQKNETITDLMAHTQTKTPTQAAEFIIARNKTFEENLLRWQKNIVIRSQQIFSVRQQALALLNSTVVNKTRDLLFAGKSELVNISSQLLSRPKIILYNRFHDIASLVGNIRTFKSQYLKNQSGYLQHYHSVIRMMAPDNILKKGFAIVKIGDRITGNPDDIAVGEEIDIILSDTLIKSTVTKKTKYDGSDFNL